RAHTEAVNITREAVRIVNTQDVFLGALFPAAILLALAALVTWRKNRGADVGGDEPRALAAREWSIALGTVLLVGALLAAVTAGFLYAVEAAATGAVGLVLFGVATRTLTREIAAAALRETMVVTGALF